MSINKTLALCSASAAVLLAAGSPVWAQNATADAAPQTAQESPSSTSTTAQPDVAGASSEPGDTEVEALVVTGLRRSMQSTVAIRRNSDQIVDAVVAEDIGKLPDVTASDSLARLPGIQVERGGGEAGRVLVRGLPDPTTTYNGRDIFTAEVRTVAIQDFPAGGVAALEVYKSSTANLIEPSIAGLVNVRSRRPFDFKGLEISGSARASYATQSGQWDPNWNILVSDRWETAHAGEIGALVNVSWTQLHYLDSARFNGGFIAAAREDQVTDPALIGVRYPDAVGIFYGQANRVRPSVNASVQWRPNDQLEIYGDFLYQGFRNYGEDRLLFVPLFGGNTFSNIVLRPGTNTVQSLTSTGAVRPEGFTGAADGRTDTYQIAAGMNYTAGPWKFSTDLAHTDTQFDLTVLSYDYAFRTNPIVDVNFDVPEEDGGVEFSFRNFDTTDPKNMIYRGFFDRHLLATGSDIQWRGDVEYDTGLAYLPEFQFGVRYTDRDAGFDNGERYNYQEPLGLTIDQTPVDLEVFRGGFRGSDVQQLRTWIAPTRVSIRDNVSQLRDLAGFAAGPPPFNPLQHFEANEKAWAGYGQLRYEIDGPLRIDGVVGVRVVRTNEQITGTTRTFQDGLEVLVPEERESSYTDFLPAATLRVRLSEALQLRFAANQTRTRPTFQQLNPGLFIDRDPFESSGRRIARGGNIELLPIESDNLDASIEYYFSGTGSATVTLFRRNVRGFIVDQVTDINDPVYGLLRLTRPVNLNGTTIEGAEASFSTFFDYEFLPEWARGFGVQANATYIDNEGDLPGISNFSYNLVAMYERGPVSARVAWDSRSEYRAIGAPGNEFVDDVSRLDFSASYTPFENVTLTFDATNILGDPFRNFGRYGEAGIYPRDVRYEETIYAFGIRFRM
ncbi:MAG TPA: TonB-dependent receptor [Caulobacteraceae bacterium]|jgi:TonB-dependent receptor